MRYVEMSIDEAKKLGVKTVLVAEKNLEDPTDTAQAFKQKTMDECIQIFEDAKTIVKIYDEFLNSIRAFSYKQPDILNLIQKGKMSTILLDE